MARIARCLRRRTTADRNRPTREFASSTAAEKPAPSRGRADRPRCNPVPGTAAGKIRLARCVIAVTWIVCPGCSSMMRPVGENRGAVRVSASAGSIWPSITMSDSAGTSKIDAPAGHRIQRLLAQQSSQPQRIDRGRQGGRSGQCAPPDRRRSRRPRACGPVGWRIPATEERRWQCPTRRRPADRGRRSARRPAERPGHANRARRRGSLPKELPAS